MPLPPRLLRLGPGGAAAELSRLGVDRRGAELMLGKARHHLVRLEEVDLRAAQLLKQDMLSLGGDAALTRAAAALSVPTTPVLLMGTERQLRALAGKSAEQPFGVRGIGRAVEELLDALSRPAVFRVGRRDLLRPGRVLVMGILNATPDSFSDGGKHSSFRAAVAHGLALAGEGADIVDVGGESTRPGAPPVPPAEEARRVVPVIRELKRRGVGVISVDTRNASTAAAALEAGAAIVNDVSGFSHDPAMARTAARGNASAILMHMRGTPADMQGDTGYRDLMGELFARLAEAVARAEEAGIPRARLAVDPGIGFGKSFPQNFEILARVGELRGLGTAVAVGASRKAFLGAAHGGAPAAERLEGSLAAATAAVLGGADIIRAHDAASTARACAVAKAIREAG